MQLLGVALLMTVNILTYADDAAQYEKAYQTILEKFSCHDLQSCKNIKNNLNRAAVKKEFQENEALRTLKKGIDEKSFRANRMSYEIISDCSFNEQQLSSETILNIIATTALTVPIGLLTVIGTLSCIHCKDAVATGSLVSVGCLYAYMSKPFWDIYRAVQYQAKLQECRHEIKKQLGRD